MQVSLLIDTLDNKQVTVGLKINGEKDVVNHVIDHRKAQVVLPLVEQLLKKHHLSLKNITAIEVYPGPGSFTGLRVGITIANTLGFLLNIPINNKKPGEMIEPIYEKHEKFARIWYN